MTSPWASNAPCFRNATGTTASNSVCRVDVVCGTRVISARSVSPIRVLTTRQGRTFAVRPRSTSQTSPRRDISLAFSFVVGEKHVVGRGKKLVFGDRRIINSSRYPHQLGKHLPFGGIRKRSKVVNDVFCLCGHAPDCNSGRGRAHINREPVRFKSRHDLEIA